MIGIGCCFILGSYYTSNPFMFQTAGGGCLFLYFRTFAYLALPVPELAVRCGDSKNPRLALAARHLLSTPLDEKN